MPAPEAKPGVQKQSFISDLNTPAKDKERADITEGIQSGDEILRASDRDAINKRYRQFEKKEMADLGVDTDALEKELDELGEDEKPEGEEEEHDTETTEGEEEDDTKKPEDTDGNPDGKEVAADADEDTEAEPDKPEGLKLDDILAAKVPIKIDGVEGEVTVADMQKSYQLQGHLTRQLQDVARQRDMISQAANQLQAQRAALDNEFKDYEEQLFTPEEIRRRNLDKENKAREQQTTYQNMFLQCRNTLYARHDDVDKLDHDPAFIEWRQNFAPMVNEQLLQNYGPGVFFPAVDLMLSSYKEIQRLKGELSTKGDTAAQLKAEREKELKEREAQQRGQKKKASADVKPSTTRVDTGNDESSNSDGGRNYVRKMKDHRYRLQGLTPRTPDK